ncbi:hypothetical protein MFLO_16120 [Listeria floridensis FSL S10-1187]|uniref:Phage tail tape measure protein domain-containing protein n=1 Tax=Listeria floridensis FSL S10-1187 TaxID=1265817 RepID=A0ABP3AVR8_9LIST|nr:phage tail tape measure protein [Listeria floridensis]EUJ23262.1 hypothetical protein MFLO_16120 [Listeria floridensis FSL S10-1187]
MSNFDILVRVGADINDLSRKFNQAHSSAQSMSKNIGMAGAAIAATFGAVSVGLVKGIGASVRAAADFESAWAGVEKTVDGSATQMKSLQKELLAITKNMPQSTKEIFAVAEAAGQLGIKRENIAKFTKTMLDLGVATNMTSDEAATNLARLANITQMPQKNFDRLGATVVDLGNNFATTEKEIVEMGLRLAGQGKQVGMSEAKILGLATAMSSVGIQAEAGGTAMTMVMKKINNAVDSGGAKLTGFAKLAGMSANEFKIAWKKDAASALDAVVHGLSKSSKEGKNLTSILSDLGIKGIRESDVLLRLSGNADLLTSALNTANKAWKDNTALLNEANKRYATFDSQVGISKKVMTEFMRAIGTPLKDVLGKLLQFINKIVIKITEFINRFNEAHPTLAKVIAVITLLVTALMILGTIVGSAMAAWAAFGSQIMAVIAMIAPIAGGLGSLLAPFLAIAGAVILLTTLIIDFCKTNETMKRILDSIVSKFKNALMPAVEAVKNLFAAIKKVLTDFANAMINSAKQSALFVSVMKVVNGAVSGVVWLFDKFVGVIAFVAQKFADFVNKLTDSISSIDATKASFQGLGDLIKKGFGLAVAGIVKLLQIMSPLFDRIGAAIDKLLPGFSKFTEKLKIMGGQVLQKAAPAFAKLKSEMTEMSNGVVSRLSAGLDFLGGVFGKLGGVLTIVVAVFTQMALAMLGITGPLGIVISLLVSFVATWIKTGDMSANGITKVFTGLTDVISKASTYLAQNLPRFISMGVDMIANLVQGIMSSLPSIITAVVSALGAFSSAVSTSLPVIVESGVTAVTTFAETIASNIPLIAEKATEMISSFANSLISGIGSVADASNQIGGESVSGLDQTEASSNKGVELIHAFVDAVARVAPSVFDASVSIMTAFAKGITDLLPKLVTAVSEILTALIGAITQNLPKIISTWLSIWTGIIDSVVSLLPALVSTITKLITTILTTLVNALPQIINAGVQILTALIQGIVTMLPMITGTITNILTALIEVLVESLPKIINAGVQLLISLIQGIVTVIPQLIEVVMNLIPVIVGGILAALPMIIAAGIQILTALIGGLIEALPQLLNAAITILMSLIECIITNLPLIIDAGIKMITSLISGIIKMLPDIIDATIKLITTLLDAIIKNLPKIIEAGVKLLLALIQGLIKVLPQLLQAGFKLIIELGKALIKMAPQILSAGVQLIWALIKGLLQMLGQILAAGGRLIVQLIGKIGSFAGQLVAKGAELIGKFISGIGKKAKDVLSEIGKLLKSMVEKFKPNTLLNAGKAIIDGFLDGLKSSFEGVKNFVGGIADWIKDHKGPISYDKKLLIPAGRAIMTGLNKGLGSEFKSVMGTVMDMSATINKAAEGSINNIRTGLESGLNGAIGASVASSVDANVTSGGLADLIGSKLEALGDRIDGMEVSIDGKKAGQIVAPHVSEAEAKAQRYQFKARGMQY